MFALGDKDVDLHHVNTNSLLKFAKNFDGNRTSHTRPHKTAPKTTKSTATTTPKKTSEENIKKPESSTQTTKKTTKTPPNTPEIKASPKTSENKTEITKTSESIKETTKNNNSERIKETTTKNNTGDVLRSTDEKSDSFRSSREIKRKPSPRNSVSPRTSQILTPKTLDVIEENEKTTEESKEISPTRKNVSPRTTLESITETTSKPKEISEPIKRTSTTKTIKEEPVPKKTETTTNRTRSQTSRTESSTKIESKSTTTIKPKEISEPIKRTSAPKTTKEDVPKKTETTTTTKTTSSTEIEKPKLERESKRKYKIPNCPTCKVQLVEEGEKFKCNSCGKTMKPKITNPKESGTANKTENPSITATTKPKEISEPIKRTSATKTIKEEPVPKKTETTTNRTRSQTSRTESSTKIESKSTTTIKPKEISEPIKRTSAPKTTKEDVPKKTETTTTTKTTSSTEIEKPKLERESKRKYKIPNCPTCKVQLVEEGEKFKCNSCGKTMKPKITKNTSEPSSSPPKEAPVQPKRKYKIPNCPTCKVQLVEEGEKFKCNSCGKTMKPKEK